MKIAAVIGSVGGQPFHAPEWTLASSFSSPALIGGR